MTEFFNHPNEPTEQELRLAQAQALASSALKGFESAFERRASEISTAASELARQLTEHNHPFDIQLVTYPTYVSGGFLRRPRHIPGPVMGGGWVIASREGYDESGVGQDGYAASMNNSSPSPITRTIALNSEGRLLWGQKVVDRGLTVFGEVGLDSPHPFDPSIPADRMSAALKRAPGAPTTIYVSPRTFYEHVTLNDLERDLRSSGRRLLGYE